MAFLGEMIPQDVSHITTRIMLLSYLEFKKKNSTSHSSLVKEFCISKFFLSNWKPLGGWLLWSLPWLDIWRLFFDSCSTIACRVEAQGICCSLFVFLFWVETLLRPQKLTSHSKMVCEWNRSLFVAECKNLHFVTPKSLSRKILGKPAILKKK